MQRSNYSVMSTTVDRFFDRLTDSYTETILRCFPRYPEMLGVLLGYLPQQLNPTRILELGCGTGNLSAMLREQFPDSSLHLVDISPESIEECRRRLAKVPNAESITYQCADFRDLRFSNDSFDLVISSISIHHLDSDNKRILHGGVFDWLRPAGVYTFADQHAGVSEDVYQSHIAGWKRLAFDAGSTEEEWQMWMQHQSQHDFHDPLPDQINWLQEAGFVKVDCLWRYLLWCVVQAQKPL